MQIRGLQVLGNTCLHIWLKNSENSVISSLENDTEGELTCLQPHSIQFLDQILSPQMRIPFQHLHGLVPADGCNFLI